MYVPNLKWSAEAILETVEQAELVLVEKNRYLGIWYGDYYVHIYDLTTHPSEGYVVIPLRTNTILRADNAITDYVITLQDGIPEEDLTAG
jgi:hypothetical protein